MTLSSCYPKRANLQELEVQIHESQKTYGLERTVGNSLADQWLGLHASTGLGLIPGWGPRIPESLAAKNVKGRIS